MNPSVDPPVETFAANIRVEGNSVGSTLIAGTGNSVTIVYGSEVLRAQLSISDNPYRGLDAFDEASSSLFFGRERLVAGLPDRLLRISAPGNERGSNRLLAVVGPSGCGKTSVVRAGLLPALAGAAAPWLQGPSIAILRPGHSPIDSLADALARLEIGKQNLSERRQEFSGILRKPAQSGKHSGLIDIVREHLRVRFL